MAFSQDGQLLATASTKVCILSSDCLMFWFILECCIGTFLMNIIGHEMYFLSSILGKRDVKLITFNYEGNFDSADTRHFIAFFAIFHIYLN